MPPFVRREWFPDATVLSTGVTPTGASGQTLRLQLLSELHRHFAFGYHSSMQVVSGTVIGGKVVVEGLSLPEGTAVTVLARGDEAVVRLSPKEEGDLLAALDEADREEGVPAEEFFARLRRFG